MRVCDEFALLITKNVLTQAENAIFRIALHRQKKVVILSACVDATSTRGIANSSGLMHAHNNAPDIYALARIIVYVSGRRRSSPMSGLHHV